MWCAALVLLDVVGSGCGALRCGVLHCEGYCSNSIATEQTAFTDA